MLMTNFVEIAEMGGMRGGGYITDRKTAEM
jgi:hypothetical protein